MFSTTQTHGLNQGQILCGPDQRLYIHRPMPVLDQLVVPYEDRYPDGLVGAMRETLLAGNHTAPMPERIRALAAAYSRDNLFSTQQPYPTLSGATLSTMVPFTLIEKHTMPSHSLALQYPYRVISTGWLPAGQLNRDTPLHITRRVADTGYTDGQVHDVLDFGFPPESLYVAAPSTLFAAADAGDGVGWSLDPQGTETVHRHVVPSALAAPNCRMAQVLRACYNSVDEMTAGSIFSTAFDPLSEAPYASVQDHLTAGSREYLSCANPPPRTLGEAEDREITLINAGVRELSVATDPTPLDPTTLAAAIAGYLTGLLPALAAAGALGSLAVTMPPGKNAGCSGTTLHAVGMVNALAEFRLAEHLTRMAEAVGEFRLDAFLTLSGTTRVMVTHIREGKTACVVCPTPLTPYRSPLLMTRETFAANASALSNFIRTILEG